jgi:Glycine/sarcosine/betaine reductase component B subunits
MRLELGTFPVHEVAFGSATRWQAGRLEIDRDAILRLVRADPRIATADLELAGPGESVRIWPVRDVVEPRVKVDGAGQAYPGIVGRDVQTVGQGRTHRLAGLGVVEVSNIPWHDAGGDHVELFIDMLGPWADELPLSQLQCVCLVVEPELVLDIDEQNAAVHQATLKVSDLLAACVAGLEPPQLNIYELPPAPELPGVVYIQCVHSPQAMSGSAKTFGIGVYGLAQLTPPWLLHPNELLDGAVSGPYRTAFATSWATVNNPLLLELYARHGVNLDLRGVLVLKTEWTTQREKELTAAQAAKMAKMLGASGAVVTWDAGGNEFLEVIYAIRDLEHEGIKTVFLTSEDNPAGGVPTTLLPLPEADAIVSTGYFHARLLEIGKYPPVDRVIGNPVKKIRRDSDGAIVHNPEGQPTAGEMDPPWRYDDHYGFNHRSVFAY